MKLYINDILLTISIIITAQRFGFYYAY